MKSLMSLFCLAVTFNAIPSSSRKPRGADKCENLIGDRSCNYYLSFGLCSSRRTLMMKSCKKACRFCTPRPCKETMYGCCFDGKTTATGPHLQGCESDCKDTYDKIICRALKKRGFCLKQNSYNLKRKCSLTCGFCRPCVDLDEYECRLAAKYGSCMANFPVMAERCRKSCNFCGPKDPCYNHMCPEHSVCTVGSDRKPVCHCDGNCHKGDLLTGVVCGRDGVQYKNLCELKRRNCGHPTVAPVTVNRFGNCPGFGRLPSPNKKVCNEEKDDPQMCKSWVQAGFCLSRKREMMTVCPKSCNFCAVQTAKPACHYTKHGCCLDGKTPCLNTNYEGCPKYPECKDFSKTFCERFVAMCGKYKNKNKTYMKYYCPKSCRLCG